MSMRLRTATRFTSKALVEGLILYVFYHLSLVAWSIVIN